MKVSLWRRGLGVTLRIPAYEVVALYEHVVGHESGMGDSASDDPATLAALIAAIADAHNRCLARALRLERRRR